MDNNWTIQYNQDRETVTLVTTDGQRVETPFIVAANGLVTQHEPANGIKFTADELEAIVGGKIEILDYSETGNEKRTIVVCNQESKRGRLVPNFFATNIALTIGQLRQDDNLDPDAVAGAVVFCPSHMVD